MMLFRRRRKESQPEPFIGLSAVEACHCFEALGFLASNGLFADVFPDQFLPAAETFAKFSRAISPGSVEETAVMLAEADRAAAEIADLKRRSPNA